MTSIPSVICRSVTTSEAHSQTEVVSSPTGCLPVISVIVPVYNEVSTIVELLGLVLAESTPKEIIVVDDGSTDGTADRLESWRCDYELNLRNHVSRILVLRHEQNRGKGAAIRTGLELANAELCIVQDADLEVLPQEYPWLIKPLAAGEADFVIGYRTTETNASSRLAHGIGIQLLNWTVRILYGERVRDEACCFKVLRTRDLKRMQLVCEGFEFCPEVVAKSARLGLRFAEVPVAYAPRTANRGKKLRLHDGVRAMWTLWKHRHWRVG